MGHTILGHIKISEGLLIAEVNSEERAKRLRNEIEKRLGSLAVYESALARTLEEMRKNPPQQETAETELRDAEFETMLRDPEVRKQLQATMQKQVESWVHETFVGWICCKQRLHDFRKGAYSGTRRGVRLR